MHFDFGLSRIVTTHLIVWKELIFLNFYGNSKPTRCFKTRTHLSDLKRTCNYIIYIVRDNMRYMFTLIRQVIIPFISSPKPQLAFSQKRKRVAYCSIWSFHSTLLRSIREETIEIEMSRNKTNISSSPNQMISKKI